MYSAIRFLQILVAGARTEPAARTVRATADGHRYLSAIIGDTWPNRQYRIEKKR
jgi:hypothetical protein